MTLFAKPLMITTPMIAKLMIVTNNKVNNDHDSNNNIKASE